MLDTHPRPNPRAAVPRAHTLIRPVARPRNAWLAPRVTTGGDAAARSPVGTTA